MKHLKEMVLFLSALLSTFFVKAELIDQHFSSIFGSSYYNGTPTTDADGWSYVTLERETGVQYVYYGEASVSIQANTWGDPAGYLATPEKIGGVGTVMFRYKTHNSSSYNSGDIVLYVQTSEDGAAFNTVGTVMTRMETAVWKYAVLTVNDASAKHVRLQMADATNATVTIDVDELVVTDNGGATISVTVNAAIESEVGVEATIPNAVFLQGTDIANDVTLAFINANSLFTVSPATISAADANAGIALDIGFTPDVKNTTVDYLKMSGTGLPDIYTMIEGVGLLRKITEDFNINTGYLSGNFEYIGWQVNGDGEYIQYSSWGTNDNLIEGEGSIAFGASLISPAKAGGIGSVSFMYKGYKDYSGTSTGSFNVYTSTDKTDWTEVGAGATTDAIAAFSIELNDSDAKYIKIVPVAKMVVDAFVITENGQTIASVTGNAVTVSTAAATPYVFDVPLTFANISGNVDLAIDNEQLTLGATRLTQEQAKGMYLLSVIYEDKGEGFVTGTLIVSGGGIPFPAKIPIKAYVEKDNLYVNFDGEWPTSSGNYIVEGWSINKGSRDSYLTPDGSGASAAINGGGSIVSPPKSNGVGTIQFHAKGGAFSDISLIISTSEDGNSYTPFKTDILPRSNDFNVFEYEINSATAKYVKIENTHSYSFANIDNITVTKNGTGIAKVTIAEIPVFMSPSGQEQTLELSLEGINISSDITVSVKNGDAFSVETAVIPQADINGKTYKLPVKFNSEQGAYFTDKLILSGGGFSFDLQFPLKGYILHDLLYQDFNGTWNTSNLEYPVIDGWEAAFANQAGALDAYEGSAAMILAPGSWNAGDSKILSVPKSGGVGTVSFYYRNPSSTEPAIFKIQTYKTYGGQPVVIKEDTIAYQNPVPASYSLYELKVNDPDAMFVEIVCPKPEPGLNVASLYIDAIAVSANGKAIPGLELPTSLRLAAYAGETGETFLNIAAESIDGDIHIVLKNGSVISSDQTTLTPAEGHVDEIITLSYTPAEAIFNLDTLVITGSGLLKSYEIPVFASVYQDELVQDFNYNEGEAWTPSYNTGEGNGALNGWLFTKGRRNAEWEESLEGNASLRLNIQDLPASIISPAKAGGINNVSFYWRPVAAYEAVTVYIQTSADGRTWKDVDTLITLRITESTGYHLYDKKVADKNAHYLRLWLPKATSYFGAQLFVDSIVLDAMPYIRLAGGDISEVETSVRPAVIPVEIAGWLSNNATIRIDDPTNFSINKAELTPIELADGKKVTFNVTFNGSETGEYFAHVTVSDENTDYLTIPIIVIYTRPYIEVVNTIEAITTGEPVDISVEVEGLLNTDAAVSLKNNESAFTLSQETISAALLAEGKVTFTVAFAATVSGTYADTLLITNSDIETVSVPLKVVYAKTGLDKVSSNVNVYFAPNGTLNISGASPGSRVDIFNVQGQRLFSLKINSFDEKYDLLLSTGIYIVKTGDRTWKLNK
jgi:hypothetical protein